MIDRVENPGQEFYSSANKIGELLKDELQKDLHFYLFSPDETTSNKLDAVYQTESRAWDLPKEEWDLPESAKGRIVELLSENTLFATMVGHIMNDEQAMMTSYESFFSIITSQLLQQIKFLKQSDKVAWRRDVPAINLLSTSTCWRQDHNGFTHQSPALISTLISLPSNYVNLLFPIDDVAAESTFRFMFQSKNVVNLTTFNKSDEPRWIDSHHADFQFDNGGASIFGFASDYDPDYIFTAAGDIVSREALYAMKILRQDMPHLRLRFVGINALSRNAIGTTKNKLSQETFSEYFTTNKPIIANFHGYPGVMRTILAQYTYQNRYSVHGFIEHGTTTTPFEMLSLNYASRYHLAIDVAEKENRLDLVEKYRNILQKNTKYAHAFGVDLPEITDFRF